MFPTCLHPSRGWIRRAGIPGLIVSLPFAFAGEPSLSASTIVREAFGGVTHIERTDWPDIPRPVTAHILIVDLDNPDIRFRMTPPRPRSGHPDPEQDYTQPERTLDYLTRMSAQVAINANFYETVSGSTFLNPRFLAVSNGIKYSKIEGAEPALNIDSDNHARIVTRGGPAPTYETSPSVSLHNAAGGNERIVFQGENKANPGTGSGSYYGPRARTVLGLTRDNRTLVIITVDEGQAHSQGVTPPESADLLLAYGVWDGINLDGGGSTTLAMADPDPRLVNSPSASPPRAVATNLAIFAAPPPPDGIDPDEFLNLRVTRGIDEAVVSWETRRRAGARVRFGTGGTLDRKSILLIDPANRHNVLVTDLDRNTVYNYQLVAMLENNGEPVLSPIQTMGPAGDIIVDNLDPEAAFSEGWQTGAFAGGWGPDYRFAFTGNGERVATYTPTILIAGEYKVATWYLQGANRAIDTPFTIVHSDGAETVLVNQQTGGSQWRPLLPPRSFPAGSAFAAEISSNATGGDVVIADAIRWQLTEPAPPFQGESPPWWTHHFLGEVEAPGQPVPAAGNRTFAESYILGADPTGSRPSFTASLRPAENHLLFEFFPSYPDREYVLQSSENLIDWAPVPAQDFTRKPTGHARIALPAPAGERLFYRLETTRPQALPMFQVDCSRGNRSE